MDVLSSSCTIKEIRNVQWSGLTEGIVEITNAREVTSVSSADINLFLASLLVVGLIPEPSFEDYFKQDSDGIFGSVWMQHHFSRYKFEFLHAHTHLNANELIEQLNINIKSC